MAIRVSGRATPLRDDYHPWDGWLAQTSLDASHCVFGPVYRDSALVLQAAGSGKGAALGRSWLAADALRMGSLCRIGTMSV